MSTSIIDSIPHNSNTDSLTCINDRDQFLTNEVAHELVYNFGVTLSQYQVAICGKTYQKMSALSIQNLSKDHDASIFITPAVDFSIYTIPKNSRLSVVVVHDWNGAELKVANISTQQADIWVTLF
jgi:hypothetical protein